MNEPSRKLLGISLTGLVIVSAFAMSVFLPVGVASATGANTGLLAGGNAAAPSGGGYGAVNMPAAVIDQDTDASITVGYDISGTGLSPGNTELRVVAWGVNSDQPVVSTTLSSTSGTETLTIPSSNTYAPSQDVTARLVNGGKTVASDASVVEVRSVGNSPSVDMRRFLTLGAGNTQVQVGYNAIGVNNGPYTVELEGPSGTSASVTSLTDPKGAATLTVPATAQQGTMTFRVKDSAGNILATDTARHGIAPTISGVTLSSSSGNMMVSFESNQQLGNTQHDITATVFGPNGKLYSFDRTQFAESGSGPYTYTLTASQSFDDGEGTYSLDIGNAIAKADGDDGATAAEELTDEHVVDRTAPTISGLSLSEDDSDNLVLSFESDEQLGSDAGDVTVTVDGPNTQNVYTFDRNDFSESQLFNGDYEYELSTTQRYDDGNGDYAVTVDDAKDSAGNNGGNNGGGSANLATYSYPDATAPSISNLNFYENNDKVQVSFTSDERLGSDAGDVTVTVDGPNNQNVYTFDRNDFMEFQVSGGYQYQASTSQAYDDGEGTYTASLDVAEDTAGNNGGNTGSGSGLTANYYYTDASVTSKSLSIISGPGDRSQLKLDAFYSSGLLQVQVKDTNDNYDLDAAGVTKDTVLKMTVTVDGDKPRALIGNGHDVSWTRTDNGDGTWTIEVTAKPSEVDYLPNPGTWDGTKQATYHRDVSVSLATSSMRRMSSARQQRMDGIVFITDAQSFSPPRYVTSGSNDRLEFDVSAAHFTKSGKVNYGFAEVFIPDAMLTHWGVTADGISGTYNGQSKQTQVTEVTGGVFASVSVHYSSGTAAFTVDSTAPVANAGSDQMVDAGTQTTLDASGSTDNVGVDAYDWDLDGDGNFDDASGSSVAHTFTSAGTKTVTVRATDGAGNTDTDTVTVNVQSTSSGGGVYVGGTSSDDEETTTNVEQTGTSTTVEVVNPGDEPVTVDVGQQSETGAVSIESLSLSTNTDADYTLDVSTHDANPGTAPEPSETDVGTPPVGYLQIDHSVADDHISAVDFEFSVSASTLDARGIAPEDVVLYRYHDGSWNALDTTMVRQDGGTYVYTAVSPGLSTFAIGSQKRAALSVADATIASSEIEVGTSALVSATVENTGSANGSTTVDLVANGEVLENRTVTVAAGSTETVTFETAFDVEGDYDLRVAGTDAGTVSVVSAATSRTAEETTEETTQTTERTPETTTTTSDSGPGFGVVVGLFALVAGAVLGVRQRR